MCGQWYQFWDVFVVARLLSEMFLLCELFVCAKCIATTLEISIVYNDLIVLPSSELVNNYNGRGSLVRQTFSEAEGLQGYENLAFKR